MPMRLVAMIVALALAGAAAAGIAPARAAEPPVFTGGFLSSVAIRGTDPVGYFREGRAVEGRSEFAFEWNGAVWHFASQANLDDFRRDPERYAPRFGGYCAWAVANGYTASTDPEAWSMHDGRLYLNYSLSVRARWLEDVPGNVARGDSNWPGVLDR